MARTGSDDAGNDATMTASELQGHTASPSQAATPASVPPETLLHGHSGAPIDPPLITRPVQGAPAEDSVGVSSPAIVSSKEASDQGDGKAVVPQVIERDNDQTSVALDGVVPQQEPDASEEYGDEDGGVIRCICQCDDDDGFTIQCDKCLVWQHCACFGMSQASVPEEYHCEQCDPRPVDVAFAKAHQQKRRDAEARKASLERSIRRNSQAESAAAASTHAQVNMDGNQVEADTPNEAQRGQQVFGVANVGGISRPRKPSQQLDLTNVTFASADGPSSATATPGSARSNRKKGSGPKTSRKSSSSEVPSSIALTPRPSAAISSTAVAHSASVVSAGRGEDRADGEDMSDRMEGWQVEFTPTNRNIIADETIQASLSAAILDLACGSPLKADNGTGNCLLAPVVGRKVKTLANMGVPSEATKGADLQESCAMPSMAAEYGLSAIGNECIPVQMATSSLAACSQKTYVKQVSELASASIFNSLLQVTPLPSEPQRPWSASRTFSKPVMHGLFADSSIPAGCFISEYTGELSNADRYRQDPVNQYQWTGTSKPSVHLFPPPLNLCVDARRFGSTSRFARFSCHPNAVLRPIIITPTELTYENVRLPSSGVESKQNQMFFGLFAIADIPRTHEITLGWEWDDAHIVHILPQLVRNPTLGVLEASGVPPLAPSTGNQRSLERERRNAAIALLVDKGDFPYIGTMFSQKMNTILTVLLSTCLCACIGSAAAPSGHGGGASNAGNSTASSNNVKRQDCAILQMLRLSQGMNMLNVYIPGSSSNGKTSRKSKAPDFEPLIGKQRWWRPRAMPLTPSSLLDEEPETHGSKSDDCHRQLDVRYKLLPGGKVGRVEERDFEDAMGRERVKARLEGGLDGDSDDEGGSNGESRRSNASSLTEPLSGRSDEEDEEDSLLGGDDVTIARQEGGASYLTRTALPPKKRVSGTRLKAVCSGGDDSDIEFKGRKRHKGKAEQRKEGLTKKGISKSRASPTKNDQERRTVRRQSGKKRRNRRMYEPSSPLTSAPSEGDSESEGSSESDDDTPTTPLQSRLHPTLKRKEIQREASDEQDPTVSRRKKKADSESRKKAKVAKKRRRELLGDLDVGSDGSSGPEQKDLAEGAARGPSPSPARRMAKKKPVKHIEESDDSASADEEGQMVQQRSIDQASQQSAAVGGQDARMQAGMHMAMEPQSMPPASVPLPTPPSPPPAPVIEVPKAKLSLADYKKRLAERRTTASVQSAASTPLSTPTLPGMASPEKQPLPTTPSSAPATQLGFGFPSMSRTAMPESVTTPTTYKTEFAPPAPRFARPSTPPRVPSLPSRGGSVSVSSTGSNSAMPSAAPNLPPPPPPTPPSSMRLPDKTTPSEQSAPLSASATTQAAPFGAPPMEHESMPIAEGQHPPARPPAIHPGFAPVRTPFESRLPQTTSAPPPASTISRPERAMSISQQSYSPPTTPATFNPPRGPRALINSPLTSTGSSATPTPLTAASPSTGPLRSNSGSVLSTSTPSTGPAPTDGMLRHQRPQSSFDGSLPRHGMRNQSPTRPPPLASPTNSMGSSYGLTGSSVPPQTTANHPAGSASSLNDFANVPKGPARMREREKEREIRERDRMDERDYREPIPPPREQWEREREREAYMRDRDWQDRDGREREHSYDRRRLDDDDRTDNPSIRPPFPPRGAGSGIGRGAFLGSAQGMGGQWPGRARTRGRGSRGGWR